MFHRCFSPKTSKTSMSANIDVSPPLSGSVEILKAGGRKLSWK